ncbi:hypothetical protein HZH66_000031 [Vespula vulgaris]|uniref:Uncharacterized protein n=1 Tax=Vespula vulgaris TaxID=7454 RepID=A0A834NI90_VESVU|nr:hypothetical protein HZH66_000031 [Vespula vulgaris]
MRVRTNDAVKRNYKDVDTLVLASSNEFEHRKEDVAKGYGEKCVTAHWDRKHGIVCVGGHDTGELEDILWKAHTSVD